VSPTSYCGIEIRRQALRISKVISHFCSLRAGPKYKHRFPLIASEIIKLNHRHGHFAPLSVRKLGCAEYCAGGIHGYQCIRSHVPRPGVDCGQTFGPYWLSFYFSSCSAKRTQSIRQSTAAWCSSSHRCVERFYKFPAQFDVRLQDIESMFHFIVARNLPVAPVFGGVEGPSARFSQGTRHYGR